MISKKKEECNVLAVIPQDVFLFHPAGEETFPFQVSNQTKVLFEVMNQSNRAVSAFPKRQKRQGRVSNVTDWASEEKQHHIEAQKTQSGGVHEPFQSFVEHPPGLTHIIVMLQQKYRQLTLCFLLYECAGNNT